METKGQGGRKQRTHRDHLGLFRAFFDQAAVGVAQVETTTGRFLRVNQRFADIVGCSRQELERLDVQAFTHPEDRAADLAALRRLAAGQIRELAMERRYRRKDGSVVWVNVTASPLWAPGERPTSHVAVVEDITARKAAEDALQRRAGELAALNTLGRAVNATLSLEQTMTAALQAALEAVGSDTAFLFSREGERLTLRAVLPAPEEQRLGLNPAHRVGECICGLAVQEGRPLYSSNLSTDHRCTWVECKRAGLKSMAALPLRSGGEITGVMGLASLSERDFERQAPFLNTLADQVAVALNNAWLFETTQRELAQRREAEAGRGRLTAVLEGTSDLVSTSTPDGRLTYLNRAGRRLAGWADEEPLEGRVIADLHPSWALTKIETVGLPAAAASGHWEGETALARRDGHEVPVSQVILAHRSPEGAIEYFSTIMRDITERSRMESELQERVALAQFTAVVLEVLAGEGDLRSLLQRCAQLLVDTLAGAFARIWTLNETEQVLELQASAGLHTHLDGAHARVPVGQLKIGLIARERTPLLTNRVEGDPWVSDQDWVRREGMVAFAGYPLLVNDRVVGVMAMFARHPLAERHLQAMAAVSHSMATTIERKRAEAALQRANRALRTLSESNQAIARAASEDELLRDVCGFVVRSGGYRMAWVGYAEDDDARSLKLVAQAGLEGGSRESAAPFWTDSERGVGPTGAAIRECRPVLARHIKTDARFAAWREAALERGYASSIALPLRDRDGGCLGALTIHAADPDTFDDAEVTLLTRLAGDLAYGIRALRERAANARAEAALRESQEKYQRLIETTDTGYVIVDGQGRVTDANKEYVRLTGRNRLEEILGRRVLEWTAAHDLARNAAELKACVERGFVRNLEVDYATPTGQINPVEISATVFGRGEALQILSLCRDVAERKRAEQALAANRMRLQSVVSNAPIILFGLDPQGTFTLSEGKGLQALGLAPGEVVGSSALQIYREFPPVLEALNRALGGEAHSAILDMGQWVFEVHYMPLKDERGAITELIGVAIDITERTRAERALRESEQRYRALFEQSPDAIVVMDPETTLPMDFNDAACLQLGCSRDEFARLRIADYEADQTSAEIQASIEECRTTGSGAFEVRHRTKQGEVRNVWVSVRTLEAGGRTVFYAIWRDVTERKRAEAERERLQAQLTQAQRMESIGQLAGGVAHDFNNMLQSILGNAALALDVLPPDSEVRENLKEIQRSAERSADLTRQLLAFARKQTIAPRVLDLNDTVAGMLKMLRRLIGEDIELAWLPGAGVWPIKADPSQIDQILANLCVNARDAIDGAGHVTIETGNVTLDEAYASAHPDSVPGDYVVLSVSDDGMGMDAATQSHLFEPFFTTKGVGKGTGLGLATVFGIVKQNRGVINVYSEPGQGTTFRICLPRAEAGFAVPQPEDVGHSLRGAETVLVVEDDRQVLDLSRHILEQFGYTVLTASSPEAALAVAERHQRPIHLLITDVVMPGMNGKELRELILISHPESKSLFMSGYPADTIARHGVLDEGVAFLQKPFTNRALAAKAREVLSRSAAE